MKTTSRFAMAAAAGVIMGGMAMSPAQAADLGGDCCLDLEERVAELEATTARKGNRKVSLEVSGQVNKALLIWDDGVDSDAYVVDNDRSGTRFRFKGWGQITSGVKAGFLLEFDAQDAASDKVGQNVVAVDDVDNDGELEVVDATADDDPANELVVRHANWYIDSERFGRITVGQGSAATDGISEIVLANSITDGSVAQGGSFRIRFSDGDLTPFTIGDVASDFDGPRQDVIRYDTPAIYGFILSASWGDDDFWDVALRFKSEWNSFRFAAGVGYQKSEIEVAVFDRTIGELVDVEIEDASVLSGSASVMHVPTGLYAMVAAGELDLDTPGLDDPSFWYVQAGIEKRFLSYGATTLYGEYGLYSDFVANDSEVDKIGVGLVQQIDAAAMDVYAQAEFWNFDDLDVGDVEDIYTIMIGSRIKF